MTYHNIFIFFHECFRELAVKPESNLNKIDSVEAARK